MVSVRCASMKHVFVAQELNISNLKNHMQPKSVLKPQHFRSVLPETMEYEYRSPPEPQLLRPALKIGEE